MENTYSSLPGVISSANAGLITMASTLDPIPFSHLLSLCNIPSHSNDQRRVIIDSMGGRYNQPISFSGSFIEEGKYSPLRRNHFEVEYTTNPQLPLSKRMKSKDHCYWIREWEDGKNPTRFDWKKLE